MTGSYPKFELYGEWMSETWIKNAIDSYVITKDNYYVVRLYNSQGGTCCGTDYIIYGIDYKVFKDGEVSEMSRKKVGRVPNRVIT